MVAVSTNEPIENLDDVAPAVLNVKQAASLLGVSVRHVYRLADGGLMPRPLKLGGLNRWHWAAIDKWLKAGAELRDDAVRKTETAR